MHASSRHPCRAPARGTTMRTTGATMRTMQARSKVVCWRRRLIDTNVLCSCYDRFPCLPHHRCVSSAWRPAWSGALTSAHDGDLCHAKVDRLSIGEALHYHVLPCTTSRAWHIDAPAPVALLG